MLAPNSRFDITRTSISIMRARYTMFALVALAGCASSNSGFEQATAAYVASPMELASDTAAADVGYRIGPADKLAISVFQVPSLSFETTVDAAGNVQVPLIGSVRAAGKTPAELSDELRVGLAVDYIRNPVVNVSVAGFASQKVTVDGAVTEPGVYEMRGRTTLLQAVAMAKGPSRTARLNNVAVFRTVEGRQMVALFDLAAIRTAQAEDPILQRDDVVVVDTSRLSERIQLAIQALPALSVFAYLP